LAGRLLQAGIQSQALASAGVGAINVAGTIVSGLLVSFLGMAASMLAMSAGLGLPALQARHSGVVDSFSTAAPPRLSCLPESLLPVNAMTLFSRCRAGPVLVKLART
jgi:hypothetical protein